MEIQIAVAKINRHDSIESGDTLEFVERPNGGISVVIVDALSSGPAAKTISSMVVRKVINDLAEGVRDGAAARGASDYLYTQRNGQVEAYLNIISADLQTCTLVISRNNPTPIFLARGEIIEVLGGESMAIGTSRNIKPAITEFNLETGITVVTFTDGLMKSGRNFGQTIDIRTTLECLLDEQPPSPQVLADTILLEGIHLDNNKPQDDMSVVVLQILPHEPDAIRRIAINLPYNIDLCMN